MIFLNPTSDIAFKKLFGSSEHKNVLISFLNSVLERPEGEKIVDVVINDPNNLPETSEAKASIVDVSCTDQAGARYIVEMQVVKQPDYAIRCQYYTALALSRQLKQGEKFELLKPVIFIGILDFNLFRSSDFLSHHLIVDIHTNEHTLKHLGFHFVELEKFNKTEDELTNDLEKWIYLLRNAQTLKKIPSVLNKPAFQEAFDILEQGSWTTKELQAYDRYIDAIRSKQNQLEGAYEDGKVEGLAEGELVKARLIAKNLLIKSSLSIPDIAAITGLSSEEVKQLKNEIKEPK